ncbi:MAG: hypothetical protein EG825_11370 [Rhodocyclaceae bacterium]|nr:hypothetical protein [Rhodocyclaceae bacterium]
MSNNATSIIQFRVRDKGGPSAGMVLEQKIPAFDWEAFTKLPNARAYVEKAYLADAKKRIREIHEHRNGTEKRHLQSMENLIARSLNISEREIQEWIDSRDWSGAKFTRPQEQGIAFLAKYLPSVAKSDYAFPEMYRLRAAEIVAGIANAGSDYIADYLFTKLTQEPEDILEALLG